MSRQGCQYLGKTNPLVEFSDDTFMIGCINAYGRDWLTSTDDHLTAVLYRCLNREAKVRFVVCDQEVDDEILPGRKSGFQEDRKEIPLT